MLRNQVAGRTFLANRAEPGFVELNKRWRFGQLASELCTA